MYTNDRDNDVDTDVDAESSGHNEEDDDISPHVEAISLLELIQKEGDIKANDEEVELTPSPPAEVEEEPKTVAEMTEDELENEFTVRTSKFGAEHAMTYEVNSYGV